MALLEISDLVVGYGAHPVLHGIDFVVEEGEVCVLLGLNGAGKTTTVSTIAGLLRPRLGPGRLRREAARPQAALVPGAVRASRSAPRAGGCSHG